MIRFLFMTGTREEMKRLQFSSVERFSAVGKPEATLTDIGRVCEWAIFQSGSLNAHSARIGECRVQANHKE